MENHINIAGRNIGNNYPCYIVAEIGINHNGSLNTAKKLIDIAVLAGCDAVKFQKRTIELVYTKEELDKYRESPFGNTNGDLKRGLEFGFEQYYEIDEYCKKKGIEWFASPWDVDSVDFLETFDVPAYKVASPCITDISLLDKIRSTGKPVIMSTGGSDALQIKTATLHLPDENILLACTSMYPCSVGMINLKKLDTLKSLYPDNVIGYSNHSPGLWTMLSAVARGAKVIELHITLDRAMWGSDQAASIETGGLIKIGREIRDLEACLGDGILVSTKEEDKIMEKLRRVK